ncbi:hypothetical protein TWF281_004566 [Arthrobotrys megalospora]
MKTDQDHKILNWLSPVDYSLQQSDYFKRRQLGTGQWLLSSEEYQNWIEQKAILFCPGIPGAGKTVITSIVVNDLRTRFSDDSTTAIAYIYCNFNRRVEQATDCLLANLLKQLSWNYPSLPDIVKKLYDRYMKHGTERPQLRDIIDALHSVSNTHSRVFVVIDALDECDGPNAWQAEFISELLALHKNYGVNILATSRPIQKVVDKFKGVTHTELEIRARDEDVRNYLDGQISRSDKQLLKTNRDYIISTISKAVSGMFLLAHLYLESIMDQISLKQIKLALENIPTGNKAYDSAYNDTMMRIKRQSPNSRQLAEHILYWITFAKRPLSTLELQHALAVEAPQSEGEDLPREFGKDNLPDIQEMLSVCTGLITADEHSNIIRLIHYTTQEYFERVWKHRLRDIQDYITKICVTYLSYDIFKWPCASWQDYEDRLDANPLYEYAAGHWGDHARESSIQAGPLVMNSLAVQTIVSASAKVIARGNCMDHIPLALNTAAELAAYFGLDECMVELLAGRGVDQSKDGEWKESALLWAALNGHETTVELLANQNTNLEAKGACDRTALSWAAGNGHTGVVKLLVNRGADLESRDTKYKRTALFWAVEKKHTETIELLADHGADLEAKDGWGRTALLWAANYGRIGVVELLAGRGADLEAKDPWNETALLWAAKNGHTGVVELLAGQGADLEVRDSVLNQTALYWAARNGNTLMVKLLANRGGDLEVRDSVLNQTPLFWAARNGDIAMVRLLANRGVDLEAEDMWNRTALSWAAENGHRTVVRLLARRIANLQV